MSDEESIQVWLDAYRNAWESYDPDAISNLFSVDAEYRWHPWDEGKDVARGREAIVEAWLKNRDQSGTYSGAWRPLLVRDGTVVAVGTSRYYRDSSKRELEKEFHNLWILEFDNDGRCRSFTEWYMQAPKLTDASQHA